MSTTTKKEKMAVLQAFSLRELVENVNNINSSSTDKILKDDIAALYNMEGTWFLVYYK